MLDATLHSVIETLVAEPQNAYDLIETGEVKGRLDLGSAEVFLIGAVEEELKLVILTSSGDAAVIPADFFSKVR